MHLIQVSSTYAGQHRNVLLSVVREGDWLSVDARSRLDLPQRLAGVGVDRDEFACFLAREQQAATGGDDGGILQEVEQGCAPTLLCRQGIDRVHMADRLSGWVWRR